MRKLFAKNQPKMRGRIEFRVRTDAVAVREILHIWQDSPMGIVKFFRNVVDALEESPDLLERFMKVMEKLGE